MYIGLGIVLLMAGFILAFNVITVDLQFVNDDALGAILILGGILAIVLSLAMNRRRTIVDNRPVTEERRIR